MKTTTHIIISLLAATVVLTLVSPVFDVVPDKPVVYLDKMKTIHVREIADIVSVDSALENLVSEDNYIVSLEANDSLKDVVVNYPYQFVEVRMQGRTLHLALLPTLRGEDMTPLSMELMPNEQASDSVVAGERLEAVVRIQMPSAMLRDFLSRVNHASLRCVSLLVNGVRGDSLSFRRDLNLALTDCAFDVAEVTVPGKMLRLSRTKIGKLTFHTVPSGDGGYSSRLETDSAWVDDLLLKGRMNYTFGLDYECFGHITVEPTTGYGLDVELYNIKKKVILK